MEPQGQVAISTVVTAVVRAADKVEEEWSPSSLDALIFHVNQLYRLLFAVMMTRSWKKLVIPGMQLV
jgi:hypothetical protein